MPGAVGHRIPETAMALSAPRKDQPMQPVSAPKLCPRWNFQAPRHPKCSKPLQDYKCPQHGLIREAMPK